MDPDLTANGSVVRDLTLAMSKGQSGLASVRSLVRVIGREGSWRHFEIRETGEVMTYALPDFTRFVAAQPPVGLGSDLVTLAALCRGDTLAEDALASMVAATRTHGGDRRSLAFKEANGTLEPRTAGAGTGNMRANALRRLRRDRPDLHVRLLQGELSAHRAMVLAGFRQPTVTVPLEVTRAARALGRVFQGSDLCQLAELLRKAGNKGPGDQSS